jgi:hypothetical protein
MEYMKRANTYREALAGLVPLAFCCLRLSLDSQRPAYRPVVGLTGEEYFWQSWTCCATFMEVLALASWRNGRSQSAIEHFEGFHDLLGQCYGELSTR